MHSSLLHLGPLSLPVHGVLAALGLLATLALALRTAKLAQVDPDKLWDAGLFLVLAAYVISRITFAIANFTAVRAVPLLLLTVPSLTTTDQMLTALATLLCLRRHRLPLRRALDAWAPCAMLLWLFLALARVFTGHPEAAYAVVCAGLLLLITATQLIRSRPPGEAAGTALTFAGIIQFLLTLTAPAQGALWLGLLPAQWLMIAAIAAGGGLLAFTERTLNNQPTHRARNAA